eukprot:8099976-Pyramimonas_sp.AAC.1
MLEAGTPEHVIWTFGKNRATRPRNSRTIKGHLLSTLKTRKGSRPLHVVLRSLVADCAYDSVRARDEHWDLDRSLQWDVEGE